MKRYISLFLVGVIWSVISIGPGVYGWEYYIAPMHDRAYMEAHELLKPTGIIGQGYGIIGALLIIFGMAMYSLRKRWSVLQRWGKLRVWLSVHIFMCTTGPFLVLWHTTLKFSGIVAVSFWSMVVVLISGVLGRYVYNRIPKTEDGHFKNIQSIDDEQEFILEQLRTHVELSPIYAQAFGIQDDIRAPQELLSSIFTAIQFDVKKVLFLRQDRSMVMALPLQSDNKKEVLRLIKEFRWKTRQRLLFVPFQKIFTFWHVFHIPLATIMMIILAVHVIVAIMFGYTWIF